MTFAAFFVLILAIVTAANVFVHWRLAAAFAWSQRTRRLVGTAQLLAIASMVFARALSRQSFGGLPRALGAVGAVVEVGVMIAAAILVVEYGGRAAFAMLSRRARRAAPAEAAPIARREDRAAEGMDRPTPPPTPALEVPQPAAIEVGRRDFLSRAVAASAVALGGGSAAYGALVGRRDYTVEEVPVPIPGLPRSLDGFTIVQLSDIHIGQYVGERELAAAVDLVRGARADLVVLTGDLIDHDIRYAGLLGALARRLGEVSRRGVVAVPGNHDYYAGIDETLATLRQAGATVLKNDGLVMGDGGGGFALLGVDDPWASRRRRGAGPDLSLALTGVPADLPRILLCHNPAYFPEAAGSVALQLSGHTHGGQVNFVVRPADLVLGHGYIAGLYEHSGSRIYVNRGFGTAGPPMRLGASPEVTRIVLTAA